LRKSWTAATRRAQRSNINVQTTRSQRQKADDSNALPQPERDQQVQYEKKMRQSLELSQKMWLQYQSAACAAVSDMYEGGTMGPTAVANCKAEIAIQRAKFLRENFGEYTRSAHSENP